MSRRRYLLIGDWTVDSSTGQATRGNHAVHLTPRAVDLLRVLANHPGEVVSAEKLMDEVWSDVLVAPDALYAVVAAIRHAFGDDPRRPKYIENIPKRGYRLVASFGNEAERSVNEASTPARKWSPASRIVGAGIVVTAVGTMIVAGILMYANQRGADETQSMLHLLVIPATAQSADTAERLGPISDRLVAGLVRLDGVAITTADTSVQAGETLAPYAAAGRTLDADAVLVVRAGDTGGASVDVVDPDSETLRASIPVDTTASDSGVATDDLLIRLAEELDLSEHQAYRSNEFTDRKLTAREQETLGRFYMQRRFAEFGDRLSAMEQSTIAFQAAVNLDPDFVDGWTGLALAWALRPPYEKDQSSKEHCLEESRAAVQRALALDPNSSRAYAAISAIHLQERDLLMARAALERSHELDSDSPMVLRWLSRVHSYLGEFHLAATYSRRAAELAPFSSEILANAAQHSSVVRDFDRVFRFLDAQLDLGPADPGPLNNLIVNLREAGQLVEAINLGPRLDRALSLRPDIRSRMSWVPGMMANLYVEIDAPESAEVFIQQAERDYPDDSYTYWARSSYLLATGNTDAARAHILDWPVDPVYAHLVLSHAMMVGSDDYARQVLDLMPVDNDPLPGANSYLNRGRWLTLEQLAMGALPAVYQAYANIELGNSNEADALLAETTAFLNYWIERDIETPNALYFRAAVHGLQGRPDEGVTDLAAAVEEGFRYAWRIRIDPVLDGLRGHPDFPTVLRELEDELARQRARIDKRIDEYAQQGWSGDVKPHLVEIKGDIYAQSIE